MQIIGFHNPNEEYGFLSNWYFSDFTLGGITFTSMEQYMMYQKAVTFHDEVVSAEILKTSDVAKIKALGRAVCDYDDHIWNGVRQIVIYQGLIAKFSQNVMLRDMLLATGQATLAECAVQDRIWGIGLSMTDPNRLDMKKWQGQNLLGYALMKVREQIR